MIKLVASDLDGTLLLNGAQKLPEDIFPLIRKLKEMGILFVAASGRQYPNMKRMFAPVASDIAFVCENGALAFKDDQLLYKDELNYDLAMDIAKAAYEQENTEFSLATSSFYYIRPKTEHFCNMMLDVVKADCQLINSWEEVKETCVKAAVYDKRGVTDELLAYWKDRFADRCKVITSGFAWIDLISYETNKANGVRKYQEMYSISPDECIVFGDEYNDIEMLQSVKYSFAMSHAKSGVRAEANYEADSVQEILKKLIEAGGDMKGVI